MRVGIVASSDSNLYASTLVARLLRQNDRPACILLAEESRLGRVRASVRIRGLRETLCRIAGHYNIGGAPDAGVRSYLAAYAAAENLANWDCPLSALAARHGIKLIQLSSLQEDRAATCVCENGLDLLVNAAGVIFKPSLLRSPTVGMLNAHMGLLPGFRGMNVLEWSVWSGRRPAITVHFVTPGIDLGDMLLSREIPIAPDDTIATLRCKSHPVMIEAMADCVAALREHREHRTPQKPEDGRQYFVMHPTLLTITDMRLEAMKKARHG